jgi:hypothetical protein
LSSLERASTEGEKKNTENGRGTEKRTGERRYREGESETQIEKEKEETVSTRKVLFRRCHSQASIFSKHQHQGNQKTGGRRGHKKKTR